MIPLINVIPRSSRASIGRRFVGELMLGLAAMNERQAVQRWLRGQAAASHKQKELLLREGPNPKQAVAESLAALGALERMGLWPGPRDPVSEREVIRVRKLWARIQKRARKRYLAEHQ